jgi:hypothetical protein
MIRNNHGNNLCMAERPFKVPKMGEKALSDIWRLLPFLTASITLRDKRMMWAYVIHIANFDI